MGRGAETPGIRNAPAEAQDMVRLPEIVSCPRPKRTVRHLVTVKRVAVVAADLQPLVKGIEAPQAGFPDVFVGFDAGFGAEGPVHNGQVARACGDAVPGLTGVLEVPQYLIGDAIIASQPVQRAVPAAGTAVGAVNVAVGGCLVICSFQHDSLPEKSGGEIPSEIVGVETAVRCIQLHGRGV